MKSNHQDIIDELKDLQADFLLNNKQNSRGSIPPDLSEDFFLSVMENIEGNEARVITLQSAVQQKSYTRILRIAASFIILLAISAVIYTVIPEKPNTYTAEKQSLQQLVSQTSSQEIFDYLYETGVPADEDFLIDYVDEPTSLNTKNL